MVDGAGCACDPANARRRFDQGTIVAEVGDFARFGNPRQLMAYLGLVPCEHSSGARLRRGGITKAGNAHARQALIEGAWTYRMSARVSRKLYDRLEWLPPENCELSRRSAIDGRTTRHSGYAVSQRIRKRIEEGFGWM